MDCPYHDAFNCEGKYIGRYRYNQFIRPDEVYNEVLDNSNRNETTKQFIEKCYWWMVNNISPVPEPEFSQDLWQLPEETLRCKQGDCEDFSFLLAAFLTQNSELEHRTYVMLGEIQYRGGWEGHAWVQVQLDNGLWYLLDAGMKIKQRINNKEASGYKIGLEVNRFGCSLYHDEMYNQYLKRSISLKRKRYDISRDTGSCMITTFICNEIGLGNNCEELTTIRDFRDNYLKGTANGETILNKYYEISPLILEYLNSLPASEKSKIVDKIYHSYLLPGVEKIKLKKYDQALKIYYSLIRLLKANTNIE